MQLIREALAAILQDGDLVTQLGAVPRRALDNPIRRDACQEELLRARLGWLVLNIELPSGRALRPPGYLVYETAALSTERGASGRSAPSV